MIYVETVHLWQAIWDIGGLSVQNASQTELSWREYMYFRGSRFLLYPAWLCLCYIWSIMLQMVFFNWWSLVVISYLDQFVCRVQLHCYALYKYFTAVRIGVIHKLALTKFEEIHRSHYLIGWLIDLTVIWLVLWLFGWSDVKKNCGADCFHCLRQITVTLWYTRIPVEYRCVWHIFLLVETLEKRYVSLDIYLCCRVLFSMEVSFFCKKFKFLFLYMIQDWFEIIETFVQAFMYVLCISAIFKVD